MDRRTLLAFLLIFIVITGYQLWMAQENQKTRGQAPMAAETARSEDRGEAAGDPVREPDAAPGGANAGAGTEPWRSAPTVMTAETALAAVAEGGAERRITVRTPLYEVELAGRGARIGSWLGLQYVDHQGEPVQLIPQDDQAVPYGLDAVLFDGEQWDLGRRLFASDDPDRIECTSGTRSVTFRLRTAGDLEVRKTYTFRADSYEIGVTLELAAVGPQAEAARAALGPARLIRLGWAQGIASTEGRDRLEEAAFRSFVGVDDALEIKKRGGKIKDAQKVHGVYSGDLRFVGVQNKYFTIVGLPSHDGATATDARVELAGDPARNLQTWAVDLPATAGHAGLALYIGPQEPDRLKAYGVGLEKTMDLGWALVRPLTEATLWIMAQMRRFIPNYGVIIILFSVLTKIAFYPLTRTSTRSMKRMQQLQPKIKELQEKYKENREKQSQEMMKLYKKEKINPMAGCLPLLLQMPVFIALYQALAHTIALRNTPFFGWIDDLSKPDALFTMPFSLPFLGPDFNLLPLLMTATMVVQMRMTPTGTAPAQMAMMNTVMPVFMLFIFYQMPSGLVLYWLVNNVVTIYQTWRIHKTAAPEGGTQTS